MADVVVFGSLNADLVLDVPRLPGAGETVLGGQLRTGGGGKGGNQAVAAARLAAGSGVAGSGVVVRMAGRVGDDDHGRALVADLRAEGVDTTAVAVSVRTASGLAMIMVDPSGENLIAVAPGANGTVSPADAERLATTVRPGDIVVCQLEVPLEAVRALATAARSAGARVLLNAAPAVPLDLALLSTVDLLVVNEHEAPVCLGRPIPDLRAAVDWVGATGPALVVTLGAAGAAYASPTGESGHRPALPVTPVDTVGAGDAFVGGLAVWLATGATLADAVTAAVAAGSLATTQPGARAGLPDAASLAEALRDGTRSWASTHRKSMSWQYPYGYGPAESVPDLGSSGE